MRLDEYLCESTDLTRSQARSALASGEVTVNGEVSRQGTHVARVDERRARQPRWSASPRPATTLNF